MPAPIGLMTNVASMHAMNHLSKTSSALNKSISRLSSGRRILSAADDAAGMAIVDSMRAKLRGLEQSKRNANEAVAMLQTAEGGQAAIADILIRLRELAVQASSENLSATELEYLDTEAGQLVAEVDRISEATEYNGGTLLDGNAGANGKLTFQIGPNNSVNDQIEIELSPLDAGELGIDGIELADYEDAQSAIDDIDTALATLSTERAKLGATINAVTVTLDNLGTTIENSAAALSGIRDVDVASETAKLTANQVLMQAGVAMLSQANTVPAFALQLLAA